MSKIFLGVVLLCLRGLVVEARAGGVVYLISFHIDTYVPITSKSISGVVRNACSTTGDALIAEVKAAARVTESEFDDYRVRARVDEGGRSIYIDQGGVFIVDGEKYVIDERVLREIIRRRGGCGD
jgi:hypothetical protein